MFSLKPVMCDKNRLIVAVETLAANFIFKIGKFLFILHHQTYKSNTGENHFHFEWLHQYGMLKNVRQRWIQRRSLGLDELLATAIIV